jgi:predicted NodU family carbamoyl transferase
MISAGEASGRTNLLRTLAFIASRRPRPRLLLRRLRNRRQVAGIADELHPLPSRLFVCTIDYVEHHAAHLASGFGHPEDETPQAFFGSESTHIEPYSVRASGPIARVKLTI